MIRPSYFKYHNVWKSCKKSHFAMFFEFSRHKTNKSPFLARVKGQISSMKQTSIILNAHELTKKAFFPDLYSTLTLHAMRCTIQCWCTGCSNKFWTTLKTLFGRFWTTFRYLLKTILGPLLDHFGPILDRFMAIFWP